MAATPLLALAWESAIFQRSRRYYRCFKTSSSAKVALSSSAQNGLNSAAPKPRSAARAFGSETFQFKVTISDSFPTRFQVAEHKSLCRRSARPVSPISSITGQAIPKAKMDPLTILGTVAGLTRTCVGVAQSLNNVRIKYVQASTTLSAVSAECTILSTALCQLGQIIQRDPAGFALRLGADDGQQAVPLDTALQSALEGCALTLTALDATVKKYDAKRTSGLLPWKSKAKYIWNEDEIKDLLQTVRGLHQALGFLLTVLQT